MQLKYTSNGQDANRQQECLLLGDRAGEPGGFGFPAPTLLSAALPRGHFVPKLAHFGPSFLLGQLRQSDVVAPPTALELGETPGVVQGAEPPEGLVPLHLIPQLEVAAFGSPS